ncbi:Afadin and alpha-actinin-binding-domain-containing protein [Nemania abortiva]|nr:Afadin and alpha-actinin-binding-domain-containing protein [Nemania abortiva]
MIDPDNLRTASLYINNQLLSRGLLRDGQSIDFADPEENEGGLQATMGRIISVVNDLILRRDRDAEHRESLSSTLRTLRADMQRQTTESARQTERLNDTQRRLDIAEATERALRTQLKTAEQGIHKLKEEMAKMKSLVAQTRGACANEVRKRDRQIDSLKKAVADAGRVRGGGRSRDVITISVTGEFGGSDEDSEGRGMPAGATESEGYSLRMETNGFLTELVKGLSEENEGLLALVRRTVDGLREMSGLDRNAESGTEQRNTQDGLVTQLQPKSAEELAAELEAIVEHLRSILTNPSFVPIEEVEVRDEAIGRLRAGLETMEARWKDAVHMMDGWRRRMVASGKSVDMEDLQMGLRLSPVRVRDVEETANVEPMRLSCVQEEDEEEEGGQQQEDVGQYDGHQDEEPEPRRFRSQSPVESLRLVPAPRYDVEEPGDDSDSDSDSSIFQDDIDMDDLDVEEPNVQILQMSTADSIDSSPLPEPPKISPLKDSYSSGNRGAARDPPYRRRAGDFTTIVEENTLELILAEEKKEAPATSSYANKPASPGRKATPPRVDDDDALPDYTASYDSPLFGKSGERPSQAQLNRKLFSKPPGQAPEKRPRSVGATISPNQSRDGKESPPLARTTRSSAKKSAESSPTSRLVMDSEVNSTSGSTSTSTSTTTTSQQKQAAELAQRNASARSSPSPPSPPADTKYRNRSPARAQPAAAPSAPSGGSRLPRPNTQQSPLNMATIAAKLAASEREADAARVRAKLKAVRRSRRISGMMERVQEQTPVEEKPQAQEPAKTREETQADMHTQGPSPEIAEQEQYQRSYHGDGTGEDVDPVKRDRNPNPMKKGPRRRWSRGFTGPEDIDELALGEDGVGGNDGEERQEREESDKMEMGIRMVKRTGGGRRTSKVASRRRSTLSPWELQGLISGNVGDVESPAR